MSDTENTETESTKPESSMVDVETSRTDGRPESTARDESSAQTVAGESDERLDPEWTEYAFDGATAFDVEDLSVYYGDDQALKRISIDIPATSVTALVGPSGCGKSTFLRCLNRMNDRIKSARIEGSVLFDGEEIYQGNANLVELRRRIGMVFQEPNPFPKSIRANVAYGPRQHGTVKRGLLSSLRGNDGGETEDEIVERSLKRAALWEEVNDRLDDNAMGLSGGQQQRLCIARTLATDPEVILMDEPASALDPIATAKIEDLIAELADNYTVIIVTHNMQQAARISDQTAVFLTGGILVEYDDTDEIFQNPASQRVEDYVTGKFG